MKSSVRMSSTPRLLVVCASLCLSIVAGCDRASGEAEGADEAPDEPAAEADESTAADEEDEEDEEEADERWERQPPDGIDPAQTEPDEANLLRAGERYERLVPRATLDGWVRYANLVHEANNMVMRGPRTDGGAGVYERDGRAIAATWRRYAGGVGGLFVLRDSLYSQQDHPYLHEPYAPMLPPNWVTAAVAAAEAGEAIEPMALPKVDDDQAWAAIDGEEALFGELPPSESLFEVATGRRGDAADERAENARRTLQILNRDVGAMARASDDGPEVVAEVGAERIAESDRHYFGRKLRRERIIPILVEHPNAGEVDEGKGLAIPGREVSDEVVEVTFRAIYGRRLEDGDIAIERYDLSEEDDRRRAVAVLEALIPETGAASGDKTTVWLWVNGTLDPDKKLRGEDALEYIPAFRDEIDRADVDTDRLELFGKPTVDLPSNDDLAEALDGELAAFEELDLPMSINLPAHSRKLREVVARD